MEKISVPADVPKSYQVEFKKNYKLITKGSERLFLFACDQKIEHLNSDFYGKNIHDDAKNPEHLFKIAQRSNIGAMATQLGLIARYGLIYNKVNYIAKLNSKTNLIMQNQIDPVSAMLWSVQDVLKLKQDSGLNIAGIGFTVYLGSEFESVMLKEAAQVIFNAHQAGLVTVLWVYPRGRMITQNNLKLIPDSAGVANALGADFVKISLPENLDQSKAIKQLKIASQAAGNTKVICAGGKLKNESELLKNIADQINIGKACGVAIGRNIFQNSQRSATKLANDIAGIIYG
jgi:DhnA family fructose-bisphosphate aldolase class Ia